jgi:hypothetical protein
MSWARHRVLCAEFACDCRDVVVFTKLAQLAPAQAETQPPHVINLAGHQIHRRPILDGLTSEYQIASMIEHEHPYLLVQPQILWPAWSHWW